ncbi:hypothetical protein [Streptomyces fumanus]|uniref:Uncharacterized protein n=1 Tax=Streptomyces fumanus TaxID=67302 RepID=A0A919A4M7_9ACTN|nr:hypothetical protein [Streptomyces fumanus]GHE85246.1 hypothetical protein GCM10018772_05570 [Streptomyces fumanus]
MVDNLQWSELLSSAATDLSPFVKSLGKFADSVPLYGVGTGIAGLDGVNQIIKEARAAYGIWMRPDQQHVKPSLGRLAFGVVNVAGYTLYGAGAGGYLGGHATGGGLLLVTASNVIKQHFMPEERTYRPVAPILPLHRKDIAAHTPSTTGRGGTPSPANVAQYALALLPASPSPSGPPAASPAAPEPGNRWLRASEMETGTVRPAHSGPHGEVPRPPVGAPVAGAAAGEARGIVNPVAAAAGAGLQPRGSSRSLPDVKTAAPEYVAAARRPRSR